jgi:septum formation protein
MTGISEIKRIGTPGTAAPDVVLASASPSRRRLLASAGVPAVWEAAEIDEHSVKAALAGEAADAAQVAESLAELKAQRIARRAPGALVIGADQMLECDGAWFDKPETLDQAAEQLQTLSGRTHRLISSACVVCDGACLWHHGDHARLTMRPLSDGFIDAYLAVVGKRALESVGAYQLEGPGAQLFSRVEGDYFTILGLPLLPLLDFLRNHRVLLT